MMIEWDEYRFGLCVEMDFDFLIHQFDVPLRGQTRYLSELRSVVEF